MYLHQSNIAQALVRLSSSTHTFYGVTYLACKVGNLKVGKAEVFPIDKAETDLLERYYRPDLTTDRYYRVFRTSDKQNQWLRPDFPSKGSQRTRTSKFKDAFIHPKDSQLWGWSANYIQVLESNLYRGQRIPALSLAIWLYRDYAWPSKISAKQIVDLFFSDFKITPEEQKVLFELDELNSFDHTLVYQTQPANWEDIRLLVDAPPPPNAPQTTGGILAYLEVDDVGPAQHVEINLAKRINLFTGDNGLGKTFILECAWWALCGWWTSYLAYPRTPLPSELPNQINPRISFKISGASSRGDTATATFNSKEQVWSFGEKREGKQRLTLPGLMIYARVDGAFAVWDPDRISPLESSFVTTKPIIFTRDNIWEGLSETIGGKTRYIANGLISDWVQWQSSPDQGKFETLKKVLRRLSPTPDLTEGDLGVLSPGLPTRIPGDSRFIPTIKHPYGEIPIIYASAAVRRIAALAYLIVWTWEEHKTNAQQTRGRPQNQMVLLVDEIEAHLHPKWQRVIFASLLDVAEDLHSEEADVEIQFVVTTHSPLVMTSIESQFDVDQDKIFHLDITPKNLFDGMVVLEEVEFQRRGTVDSWLTADDVFELKEPRSVEAERAILDAISLQEKDEVSPIEVRELSERLMQVLGPHDLFWPRWVFFAKQYGVEL